MTVFVLIASALLAGVLFALLPALRNRLPSTGADRDALNIDIARERLAELDAALEAGATSADQHARDRAELEQALAGDLALAAPASRAAGGSVRWTMLVVALGVPALAAGLYAFLGSPSALVPRAPGIAAAPIPSGHPALGNDQPALSMDQLVARLDARLRSQPDDPDGWFMLGRSYMTLKRYPEAAAAFARLRGLVGDQPEVLLNYADALAMTKGGRMAGEPFELVKKALAARPDNTMALWLAGLGYQEQGDDAAALAQWRRLLPLLKDEQELAEVRGMIARVESRLGVSAEDASAPVPAVAEAGAAKGIAVEVALDPALAGNARADDTVFVFARALQGPRMPLAVARRRVGDLPLTVTLDDSMAMSPALKLSNFSEVEVSARISHSGNAVAQSGDLSADAAAVKLAAGQPVRLTISRVLP